VSVLEIRALIDRLTTLLDNIVIALERVYVAKSGQDCSVLNPADPRETVKSASKG
jgi:hypothetical protein